jgi:hypothetical protein
MTFERGGARFGARSALRFLAFGALVAIGLFGCGSTTLTYGIPVITVSVTPGDPSIKAFIVEFDGITITRTDGTPTNLFGTNSFTNLERVDMLKSVDMNELWGAPAVLEGTYASATITIDFSTAQIPVEVNGQIVNATVVDPTGVVAGVETYNVIFDPANQPVITQGVLTPININFDISASTIVTGGSTPTVTVRPYVSISNNPTYSKVVRARGLSVTTDPQNSTFTMNSRPFYDDASNPFGALTVQTTPQTVYNVNGSNFTGAQGLAAIASLPINSTLAAYGTLTTSGNGTGTSTTPVFNATNVVAGVSFENLGADRVIGTVSSISGNTVNVHGAEIITRPGEIVSDAATTQIIEYLPDLPVTLDSSTLVLVDGQPNTNATTQSISIGQTIDLNGQAVFNSAGLVTGATVTGEVGGILRLISTPAWGTVNAAAANGQLSLDLVTLGDFSPSLLTFAGTGSATGADSNAAAYLVNTNGIDASGLTTAEQLRVDGFVVPFGTAGPTTGDFTAQAITPATSEEQTLTVSYINGGATDAFVTADATNGLVLNMSSANLGPTHVIQNGPFSIDLTNPLVNVTIVPAANAQFAVGDPADNTATGLFVFNTVTGLLGEMAKVGALGKVVATGTFDGNHTFTATRIDVVSWL